MVEFGKAKNSRGALIAGAAVLVALGAAGGVGAVQATRPTVEMAPIVRTPIARLAASDGVVSVKGRVAEVYGDHFVVQDGSGRTMVAADREARNAVKVGQAMLVQGRFDDGQLHANYLIDQHGDIAAVGPAGPRPGGPGGPGPHGGPGRDGPPPPPPGCGPTPGGPSFAPPPPVDGAGANAAGALPPPPPPAGRTPPPPGAPTAPRT